VKWGVLCQLSHLVVFKINNCISLAGGTLVYKKDAAFIEKAASAGGVASSLPKWRQR
jgi:hypothetical protein